MTSLRDRVGGLLGRRRGPRVSVVLVVGGDDSRLDQARAALGGAELLVARSDDASGLDAAVAAASCRYLAFVHVDDTVADRGLQRLVETAERQRADVVLGIQVDVVGDRRRRVDGLDLTADVAPTGKLFRLDHWRAVAPPMTSWLEAPVAVAQVLAAADGVASVDTVVYERHDRQVSLPVDVQDRFRPEVLAHRLAVLARVGDVWAAQPAPLLRAWQEGLLTHLLPPLYVDALGDAGAGVDALRDGVAGLVDDVPAEVLAGVPLAERLAAWSAAHGEGDDLALLEDHLADHPHGLPVGTVEDVTLAALPPGLRVAPPPAWRRVEDVDRRLRTRVGLRHDPAGALLLDGAAFVEHQPGRPDLEVSVGDRGGAGARTVEVRAVHDASLNQWAARAHEDRSDCGFEAPLPDDVAGDGPWLVTVRVGDRSAQHLVHRPDPVRAADVVLRGTGLVGDRLRLSADRPFRVRACGGKGETRWAASEAADGSHAADLALRTDLFGDAVLLPAGRYELELASPDGRPLSAALAPAAGSGSDELVGDRLAVRLRDHGSGVRLVVAAPLDAADGSAFGQQRLRTAVYAGPPAEPRPGTWLLETFRGRSVGDSPGAVGRELLARNRDERLGLDVGYVVDDPSVAVPEGARAVVRRTREWYDAMGHAAVHVANAGAPYWFGKRPGQLHLQTWHGTPLKRIGEDRGPGDFATWRHRRRIAAQAAGWDAMVSPSPYCSEIYRSAFGFAGTVLEVGLPRNDVLVSPAAPQLREQVRARLGVEPGQRVVLYAPTWRQYVGVLDAKPLYLDAERLLADVPDAVVLLRGHYNSTRQDDVFTGHPRIRDVTRYPDVADLFLAADALVTDYSSVMFDFVLTDRPVVLLVPDLDQYRDVERGFYFDIEAGAPGPLVRSTEEVAAALLAPDAHAARRAAFRDRFCPFDDGSASRRVVDHLLERAG